MMHAPVGRGLVAIGNAAGQLVLTDPRAGVHQQTYTTDMLQVMLSSMSAHCVNTRSDGSPKKRCLCCNSVLNDMYIAHADM